MMKHSDSSLGMILCCLAISTVSAYARNETDKVALLEFKKSINTDPLGLLHHWNDSVQFCSWPGIVCSNQHHQRVTVLDVSNWRLAGHLSPYIGNLSFLRALSLSDNGFGSEIPPEIGRLFRLQSLELSNNSFTGSIPVNISGCSNLRFLSLAYNSLTGGIPRDIGLLSELRSIRLSFNTLGGELPVSIGNLSLLQNLLFGRNNLYGTVPYSFGQLTRLKLFVLSRNQLTGTIPLSVYNVSSIENFSVQFNKLEGQIPNDIGLTLPKLNNALFMDNNFHGVIPATLSNASNLVLLQVAINSFTGNIPSFARFQNLEKFVAGQNNLGYGKNGELDFLRDVVNCTKLETLTLTNNNLGGTIPEAIENITSTRLRIMGFGRNRIIGNIPTGIGNLINLEALGFEGNHLSGDIPSSLGNLRKLAIIILEDNQLSGTIPPSLQNLKMLIQMSLARNSLQGSIPPSLAECKNLEALSLAGNNLTGNVPAQLLGLSSLTQDLNLSGNKLNGSIPTEVGSLANLRSLDLSNNMFSGEIPRTLGHCKSMEFVFLQGNFLQGFIPKELDSLRGVQVIDFSRNNLSGPIPKYFEEFRGLLFLNFSFNDFEGQVPQGGVFQNASKFSISGNGRLCGGLVELKLGACSSTTKKHGISLRKKIAIIISCSILGFVTVVSLLMLLLRSKKRDKTASESSVVVSLPRVSFGDLSQATDNFSSANVIGVGSFGSVYKGILPESNTLVAVKVLNLQVSRALKSFAAECESLRLIKHRNLVKLVTVCSSIDFQGNDFKALVYEFMENGNLEEWLHSSHNGEVHSQGLSLVQRISIAIDVSSGLDYLHNHCSESIAHCDIKPSNILLDAEMVAHIGDFGLSKLLRSALSSSSTIQSSSGGVRGTIGYVAPEYAMESGVTTLGDVYSFGILLLEMFTGKRPTNTMFKDDFNLNNFSSMALPERIDEIMDPILREEINNQGETMHKCLVQVIEIGVACSSKLPRDRMNIVDVAAELRKIRDKLNAFQCIRIRR